MRVHLLANVHRSDAVEAAQAAAEWLRERGVDVRAETDTANACGLPPVSNDQFCDADLGVSFGGDGTLIRAADLCGARGIPILGVYYGRFGFVTQCAPHEVLPSLDKFLAGESRCEDRMMLQAVLLRGGNAVASVHCLNEVVLQRATTARMLVFSVEIDGHHLTSYPADGVLVSTPTGSTAYNLSAGGPILDPRVHAIILSTIAPHTLSSRPLVIQPDSELQLFVKTDGDAVLSADGQTRLHLLSGDVVQVTRSPRVTRLVVVETHDFLSKLGEKLLWSQGLT